MTQEDYRSRGASQISSRQESGTLEAVNGTETVEFTGGFVETPVIQVSAGSQTDVWVNSVDQSSVTVETAAETDVHWTATGAGRPGDM